jgi:hypothetical protein
VVTRGGAGFWESQKQSQLGLMVVEFISVLFCFVCSVSLVWKIGFACVVFWGFLETWFHLDGGPAAEAELVII